MEENWYPAENEYDPGITKEQWKNLIDSDLKKGVFTEDSLTAFACIQKAALATCTGHGGRIRQDEKFL